MLDLKWRVIVYYWCMWVSPSFLGMPEDWHLGPIPCDLWYLKFTECAHHDLSRILVCKVLMSMYSCNSACLLALNGQLSPLRASAGHRYFNANRFSLQMSLSLNSITRLITRQFLYVILFLYLNLYLFVNLMPFGNCQCTKGAQPLSGCHSLQEWATLLLLQWGTSFSF